jgi:hypothetical protein
MKKFFKMFRKVRKGANPIILGIVVVIAFLSLNIFDKNSYYEVEKNGVIYERSVYTAINSGELFERTLDSATRFAVKKVLYTMGDGEFEWSDTYPTETELKEKMDELIDRNLNFKIENVGNTTIIPGEMIFLTDVKTNGVEIGVNVPFKVEYFEGGFSAEVESPGHVFYVVENDYFKMAEIVKDNAKCPIGEKEIVDGQFDIVIKNQGSGVYQINVTDTEDYDNFNHQDFTLSVEVDCS